MCFLGNHIITFYRYSHSLLHVCVGITENTKLQELLPKIRVLETKNKNLNEELDVIKVALQGRIHRDNEKARCVYGYYTCKPLTGQTFDAITDFQ